MGSIKAYVILGSAVAIAALIFLLRWTPSTHPRQGAPQPLVLYCAAGVNPPVTEIVKDYHDQLGVTISVQYGGSGTLLSNLRVAQTGDLYLAADASYIQIAREQGLIAETILSCQPCECGCGFVIRDEGDNMARVSRCSMTD